MYCPICKNMSEFKFETKNGKLVYKCKYFNCGHLFDKNYKSLSGICLEKDRGIEISKNNITIAAKKRYELYNKRNKIVFKALIDQIKIKDKLFKVLDFGAGDGSISKSIKEVDSSAQITCVEPHKIFQNQLEDLSLNIYSNIDDVKGKYNLIILNEVIEHLNDPLQQLTKLNKLIEDNGLLFVATPLGENHLGENSLYTYNIESHLHFFTRNSLNLCLNMSGFSSLSIFDISHDFYSYVIHDSFKSTFKVVLKNFIYGNIFKRFFVLPSEHISGISNKI